jgi:hypothetical protein
MGKPSDDKENSAERYEALLRGEIEAEEFVKSLRKEARVQSRSALSGSFSKRSTRITRARRAKPAQA